MYLKKCILQIAVVAVFSVPVSAYAESWSCSNDNLVREVHVVRTNSDPVPCNVVYKKQTEGVEDQVLWSAENDEAYCIDKAKGLVATLEASGWVCTETIIEDAVDNGNVGEAAPVMEEGDKPADEGMAE